MIVHIKLIYRYIIISLLEFWLGSDQFPSQSPLQMSAQWMPDSSAKACGACKREFSLILRRHHCRVCGKIFCDDCCNRKLPIPHHMVVRKPGAPINTVKMLTTSTEQVKVCLDCWASHKQGFQQSSTPAVAPVSAVTSSTSSPVASPSVQPVRAVSPPPVAQQRTPSPVQQLPPGEYFEGVPPPANPGPLPVFPGKNAVQRRDLVGMTAMAFNMLGALNATRNDPHLSAEENAIHKAENVQAAGGITAQRNQSNAAVKNLEERHLPQGLAGFAILEPPNPGTLGHAHGLQQYDLIYGYENVLISPDTRPQQFADDMKNAFVSKGFFDILVYNFAFQRHRKVRINMPSGKPNAILGVVSVHIPVKQDGSIAGVVEPSMDIYVKAWKKHGAMYVSSGSNAVPLYAPLTSENEDLYAKISRHHNGMWISRGEYHPIYNYSRLNEPIYVEAWRYRNGMLIRNGSEYAALPMERMSADSSAAAASSTAQQQQAQSFNPYAPAPQGHYQNNQGQFQQQSQVSGQNPYAQSQAQGYPQQYPQHPQQQAYQQQNPYAQGYPQQQAYPQQTGVQQPQSPQQAPQQASQQANQQANQQSAFPHLQFSPSEEHTSQASTAQQQAPQQPAQQQSAFPHLQFSPAEEATAPQQTSQAAPQQSAPSHQPTQQSAFPHLQFSPSDDSASQQQAPVQQQQQQATVQPAPAHQAATQQSAFPHLQFSPSEEPTVSQPQSPAKEQAVPVNNAQSPQETPEQATQQSAFPHLQFSPSEEESSVPQQQASAQQETSSQQDYAAQSTQQSAFPHLQFSPPEGQPAATQQEQTTVGQSAFPHLNFSPSDAPVEVLANQQTLTEVSGENLSHPAPQHPTEEQPQHIISLDRNNAKTPDNFSDAVVTAASAETSSGSVTPSSPTSPYVSTSEVQTIDAPAAASSAVATGIENLRIDASSDTLADSETQSVDLGNSKSDPMPPMPAPVASVQQDEEPNWAHSDSPAAPEADPQL